MAKEDTDLFSLNVQSVGIESKLNWESYISDIMYIIK
jgi:hypothetical protein